MASKGLRELDYSLILMVQKLFQITDEKIIILGSSGELGVIYL